MAATDIAAAMKKACDKTTVDKGIARVETALRNWRDYPMVRTYSIAEKNLPD